MPGHAACPSPRGPKTPRPRAPGHGLSFMEGKLGSQAFPSTFDHHIHSETRPHHWPSCRSGWGPSRYRVLQGLPFPHCPDFNVGKCPMQPPDSTCALPNTPLKILFNLTSSFASRFPSITTRRHWPYSRHNPRLLLPTVICLPDPLCISSMDPPRRLRPMDMMQPANALAITVINIIGEACAHEETQ
ncbi:hypothetical protein B0T17DRAFT_537035 [Bombardia bombarda]|uniref:Uncharacterized protein n=1 Tax=Bombardia bombarda TaxID=252184 RepID=A0AA39WMH8_9PEZI|nr:hypothetical protein B0T17DRAFT_537035 [Bombardia bombarda]